MMITATQFSQASALVPTFSDKEITAVLQNAKLPKELRNGAVLCDQLNEALRTYVVERLADIGVRGISPAARSKRLKNVDKAIERVLKLIWLDGDSLADELRRAAHRLTGKSGTSFESDSTLEHVKESVELLHKMTRSALERERELEKKQEKLAAEGKMPARGSHARNTGDQAMKDLFITLIVIWANTFQTFPGASVEFNTGEVGGPFVRFVQGIFAAFANRIPDQLKAIDPGLNAKLEMKPPAIRAYLRRTTKWESESALLAKR